MKSAMNAVSLPIEKVRRNESPAIPREPDKLSRRDWLVVLGGFVAWAAMLNWMLPLPDVNDFADLGRLCLLMDRQGVLACVNENWGFAHSLSCWLLTKATGNLLISQRLLCAFGGILAVVAAERLMRVVLVVRSRPVRTWTLLGLILNPYMATALLSAHLDIIPIAFCLLGLSMLTSTVPWRHGVAGLLLALTYWFRFHFVLIPLLYPALVMLVHWRDHPWRKAVWAVSGSATAVLVSMTLCNAAHGVPSLSNQKAVFAFLTEDFSWAVDYQLALEHQTYAEILPHVRWGRAFEQLAGQLLSQPAVLLLFVMLAIQGFHAIARWSRPENEHGEASRPRAPWHLLLLCILTALIPFAYLRGLVDRVPLAFVLLAFPLMAAQVRWPWKRLWGQLTVAFVVCCLVPIPSYLAGLQETAKAYELRYKKIAASMPRGVSADRVYCGAWFPNKGDKYWNWSPVVSSGWPARNRAMQREFGILNLPKAHDPDLFQSFDYLILYSRPTETVTSFDPGLLQLGEVTRVGSLQLVAKRPQVAQSKSLGVAAATALRD